MIRSTNDVPSELSAVELEKIRYQLGQIIKSWSHVERIIEDDYVAYSINFRSAECIFAYLFDDLVVLDGDLEVLSALSTQVQQVDLPSVSFLPPNAMGFSLQAYRFTELLPVIEKVYHTTILSLHSDQ